ncbi:MAG: potassium transporter Kup [Rhizobiales bacterium]|nr:potassium transporter Kup [Hyphomicrobiales bacterium]
MPTQNEGTAAANGNGNGHGHSNGNGHGPPKTSMWSLVVGSIGVVYGDIGTSPLYAFREATLAANGHSPLATEPAVFGVLSLILWSLIIIVTLKYVLILVRADNNGEGGTIALMALTQRALGKPRNIIMLLGVIAAAFFYGDAVITPAISVLSAVEGLEVAAPALDHYVMPLAIVILIGLFMVQSRGTAKVGAFFGPVMAIWFIVIGIGGAVTVFSNPRILLAVNPLYGVEFLLQNGMIGMFTLGGVVLAVTGAEALYADLGHFGRKPIQLAWLFCVLPALILNYFGQGALVLARPDAIINPFFLLFPELVRIPVVILATAATVIASQAVITGAYSISRQAIQLGLLPRLEIRHTSEIFAGQIFMPRINLFLLIAVVLLIGLFRNSSALASAYGIAVTGTMVVTTMLTFVLIWRGWKWSLLATIGLVVPFFIIDVTFLSANLLKIVDGGWFPVALGIFIMIVMLTWRRGSRILFDKTRRMEVPLDSLVKRLESKLPPRVPGTAVFLTGDPSSTPTALLHSLKHYKVLHEHNVILTIMTADMPRVSLADRVQFEPFSDTFSRMTVRYGFMESPNLPKALAIARKQGWSFDIMSTSFFLSRRVVRPSKDSGMPHWQDRLFILLARNADDASSYFQIPTDRVVEIGTQVTV